MSREKPLTEDINENIEYTLSSERIDQYISMCNGELIKAIYMHNESLFLNSKLMSIVSIIEIVLRNSTYKLIANGLNNDDWIKQYKKYKFFKKTEVRKIENSIYNAQKSIYSKLTYKQKKSLDNKAFPAGIPSNLSKNQLKKKRIKKISVTNGKIIAELGFYFWKRMYSYDYEHHLWNRFLKRGFPNKQIKRSDVASNLEIIYKIRNRVAHNEKNYDRIHDFLKSVKFLKEEYKFIYSFKEIQETVNKLEKEVEDFYDDFVKKYLS